MDIKKRKNEIRKHIWDELESNNIATFPGPVHDIQLVNDIPSEDHDVPVDIIITPSKVIRTKTKLAKPKGTIWEKVTDDMLAKMPISRVEIEV